jgi:hypothetical protein
MSYAYSEDQLVEQPAIQLFAALGWLMTLVTNLRRTRDLLLPRLLSGAISLSTAESGAIQEAS